MNILFLADPNSIHDIKWITFFSKKNHINAYIVHRRIHTANLSLIEKRITTLGAIDDFSIVRFYRNFFTAYKLRKIIKRNNIHVFHILYTEPNALWACFKKYLKIPIVLTCRGTDVLKTIPLAFENKNLLNKIVAALYRNSFQFADYITATSNKQLDSVRKFSGRANQLMIVRTGVDLRRLQSDTSEHFPLNDSTPFILFPRYIKPIYNHELALAAIALLSPEIKRKYKMVFVGKDSGDIAYQQTLETIMCRQTDVRFTLIRNQTQEGIFELYKRASLVIMIPLSDGSPVSAMEALLCGTKLVLGPLEYDPDFLSRTIRLKRWDAFELAEVITHSLEDGSIRPEVPEETKRSFDREVNMQRMAEIYKIVCNEV